MNDGSRDDRSRSSTRGGPRRRTSCHPLCDHSRETAGAGEVALGPAAPVWSVTSRSPILCYPAASAWSRQSRWRWTTASSTREEASRRRHPYGAGCRSGQPVTSTDRIGRPAPSTRRHDASSSRSCPSTRMLTMARASACVSPKCRSPHGPAVRWPRARARAHGWQAPRGRPIRDRRCPPSRESAAAAWRAVAQPHPACRSRPAPGVALERVWTPRPPWRAVRTVRTLPPACRTASALRARMRAPSWAAASAHVADRGDPRHLAAWPPRRARSAANRSARPGVPGRWPPAHPGAIGTDPARAAGRGRRPARRRRSPTYPTGARSRSGRHASAIDRLRAGEASPRP